MVRLANISIGRMHGAIEPCGEDEFRVRQNRVVPAPVAGAKLCGGDIAQPGLTFAANPRSDGGKREFVSEESAA
jgi:hypothetical protein